MFTVFAGVGDPRMDGPLNPVLGNVGVVGKGVEGEFLAD